MLLLQGHLPAGLCTGVLVSSNAFVIELTRCWLLYAGNCISCIQMTDNFARTAFYVACLFTFNQNLLERRLTCIIRRA